MTSAPPEPDVEAAEELAGAAADWLLHRAEAGPDGLVWRPAADVPEHDPTLYHGAAGIVLALLEAHRQFGDDRWVDAAHQGARAIAAAVEREPAWSLYFGLTGMAVALRAVAATVEDAACRRAADRALERVRAARADDRWGPYFELLAGNAGIAFGALQAGDLELAVTAARPYVGAADPTPAGVNWAVRPGPARSHHQAHGTLGIVNALAAVHAATGDADLLATARAGAADVVARDEAGPLGFLVPHSDPPHRPELIERYSYGWCNGPAGDAQTFRRLSQVTGEPVWTELVDRCWHTVIHSGLPARRRPGFWDNHGRCCGTAGVLALCCDRMVEHTEERERHHAADFAVVLVADLAHRATVDRDGARWSNHEHRRQPAAQPPRTGWAMGNAGILRELLRWVRVVRGGAPDYAVPWPGHPATATDRRAGSAAGGADQRPEDSASSTVSSAAGSASSRSSGMGTPLRTDCP